MTADSVAIINELANLPHCEGQIVLSALRHDFGVTVKYDRGRYYIWGYSIEPSGAQWTNLAADRATPQQARDLAARLWRAGREFNVIVD